MAILDSQEEVGVCCHWRDRSYIISSSWLWIRYNSATACWTGARFSNDIGQLIHFRPKMFQCRQFRVTANALATLMWPVTLVMWRSWISAALRTVIVVALGQCWSSAEQFLPLLSSQAKCFL